MHFENRTFTVKDN